VWSDLVDAADWLRHDLGVSKSLWGDACLAMGRELAAVALAIDPDLAAIALSVMFEFTPEGECICHKAARH
jgi:hypothetical protein